MGLDSVIDKKEYKELEINILKVWSNMLAGLINYQRKESFIELMRQNYETFFNTIDEFLFVLDMQGNMIHVNSTVTRRLGYDTSELMGKSVLLVHPAKRRDEAGRIVGEMLAGTAEFCPVPLITKSGDYIPVETRVKHGFWDGKPVIFGVSKDISKIKLSEEKFSKAFQSNSALMAISTINGIFLEVNDTFINKLGYSRDEVIGKTSGELKLFDNHELRSDLTNLLVQNIPVRDFELKTRTKSGSEITGLFSGDLITIGEERCLLTMMVDISDRKLAEAEIIKAKSEAEKANLAKSEFLSRMSHELRTPMNSILGFAQLMEMGELNPKHKSGVKHILANGRHLLNLINEVLDISGIEAGRQIMMPEPILMKAIVNEITDLVQIAANKRRVSVELADCPANDLFVLADRLRLKQVLINLLSNAIKYNKEGGSIAIHTALQSASEQGNTRIRISISDTGPGINSEDIGKLFQPFERIGANKTETEGTGLGLMVVKKLTEAMGGMVEVESVVGAGSTFSIELPIAEPPKSDTSQSVGSPVPSLSELKKDTTILYIEDNQSNIELVEAILGEHRPDVRLKTSMFGKQTIKLTREYKPVLILLDLDLPDMQGIEVLGKLLADEFTKNIPVIIISADAMPFQVRKLMEAGAVAYLTKPLEVGQFLSSIDRYIKL
jgi:PAS domain S-box-containing protein